MSPISFPAELIALVFDELEAIGRDESLGDFARLARSYRAFAEPALDRLWREQSTLAPLIRCMPDDLWIQEEDKLTFCRAIVETDWVRFEHHHKRIRLFSDYSTRPRDDTHDTCRTPGSKDRPSHDVHVDVFRALVLYEPQKILLPNLESVDYYCDKLPIIAALIGPKVTQVTMRPADCRMNDTIHALEISETLSSFTRLSPRIESLNFYHHNARAFVRPLFNLITNLCNLRALKVHSMTLERDLILSLAKLPYLESIGEIDLLHENVHLFATEGGRFPCLKELTFTVHDEDTPSALLDTMRCHFRVLILSICGVDERDHPTRLASFAQTVASLAQHQHLSLEYLHISFYSPANDQPLQDEPVLGVFEPLLSLSLLSDLRLETPFSRYLDNRWLTKVAPAWPCIERLHINDSELISLSGDARFTLEGFLPVFDKCHRLFDLSTTLRLEPVAISQLEGVRPHQLEWMHLDPWSTVGNPVEVFRSLMSIFSNPSEITADYLDSSSSENLRELNNLLRDAFP